MQSAHIAELLGTCRRQTQERGFAHAGEGASHGERGVGESKSCGAVQWVGGMQRRHAQGSAGSLLTSCIPEPAVAKDQMSKPNDMSLSGWNDGAKCAKMGLCGRDQCCNTNGTAVVADRPL